MLRRCLCLVVVIMLTMSVAPPKAEAGWGDVSGILTNVSGILAKIKDMYISLNSAFDSVVAGKNKKQISDSLGDMRGSATLGKQKLKNEWDEQHGVYNLSDDDLKTTYASAVKMAKINQYTQETIRDAKEAQGLVDHIDIIGDGDGDTLISIMDRSQDAVGILAATQANNQINALQAAQLMRLQKIIAMNQNSQASHQARQQIKEHLAMVALQRYYSRTISKDEVKKDIQIGGLENWNP